MNSVDTSGFKSLQIEAPQAPFSCKGTSQTCKRALSLAFNTSILRQLEHRMAHLELKTSLCDWGSQGVCSARCLSPWLMTTFPALTPSVLLPLIHLEDHYCPSHLPLSLQLSGRWFWSLRTGKLTVKVFESNCFNLLITSFQSLLC